MATKKNKSIKEESNIKKDKIKLKSPKKTKKKSVNTKSFPSLNISREMDIAFDFATKLYQRFDKLIKSTVLFGSTIKQTSGPNSDIDIIIILDDVTAKWDQEMIAWYRAELEKILRANPYNKALHINTIKLSTWWDDLLRGDPVVLNIIRYGETIIDMGGFFEPLKFLLINGKIRSTPEAIFSSLRRAPIHLARSKVSELNSIEGLYWAMTDSSQAALMAAKVFPPSPEHIPANLKETFVDTGKLKIKFVTDFRDLHFLHKKIAHGEVTDLKGIEIDSWQDKTEDFIKEMSRLVNEFVE